MNNSENFLLKHATDTCTIWGDIRSPIIITANGKPQKSKFELTLLTRSRLHEEKKDHVRSWEKSFGWGLDKYPISSIPLP